MGSNSRFYVLGLCDRDAKENKMRLKKGYADAGYSASVEMISKRA